MKLESIQRYALYTLLFATATTTVSMTLTESALASNPKAQASARRRINHLNVNDAKKAAKEATARKAARAQNMAELREVALRL